MTITVNQKLFLLIVNIALIMFFSVLGGMILFFIIFDLNKESSIEDILLSFVAFMILGVLPGRIFIKDSLDNIFNYTINHENIVIKNIITRKCQTISHKDVKGFSLIESFDHFLFFTQKLIFIYLKDGKNIVLKSWSIPNYWEVRNFMLKKYTFLGTELYRLNLLGDYIFHFDE